MCGANHVHETEVGDGMHTEEEKAVWPLPKECQLGGQGRASLLGF